MEEHIAVQLVDSKGSIRIQVFAGTAIGKELYVRGLDTGDLPTSQVWGSDVQYWITVPNEEKGNMVAVLLAVLQEEGRQFSVDPNVSEEENLLRLLYFVYQGRRSTFDEFKALVEKKNIEHSFWWG